MMTRVVEGTGQETQFIGVVCLFVFGSTKMLDGCNC